MENIQSNSNDILCDKKLERTIQSLGFNIVGGGREIIPGNQSIGTIISIKQIHPSDRVRDYPEKMKAIALYHKAIYGELASQKVKYIYMEGVHIKDMRGNFQLWKSQTTKKIKDPIERDKAFVKYGGGIVYFLENPNVSLFSTESGTIQNKLRNENLDCPEILNIHNQRENYTVQSIKKLLEKHKGAIVAVIYGAKHDLSDNISDIFGTNRPVEERISFPGLAADYLNQ